MGSYTFKWEHPAEEVYVTGTFDSWTKSVKLEKRGNIFEKTVNLEIPSDKIYYKFVVDNNWTINESSPKEADKEGNVNNFLAAEVIAASTISTTTISTVAPGSTTATMAGQQPFEKDKLVGISPLPASETGVNPINLKPGERVPRELAAGDVHKHVKLDKGSYEKSDSLVGIPNPADVPATSQNTIPESSLPMPQNATINTVTPAATTAALAGQVPLESRATESTSGAEDKKKKKNKKKNEKKKQKKAAAAAANGNGSANADADDNDNDEDHSDEAEHQNGDNSAAATAAAVGGSVAAVAAAVAAGATVAAGKISEQAAPTIDAAKSAATEAINRNLPEAAKEKLPEQVKELLGQQETAQGVPTEVKESIQEAGKSPEAAANAAAVEEKKAVESELLKEVKPAPATAAVESELLKEVKPAPATAVATAKGLPDQQKTAQGVPAEVKESIQEAGQSPEAAANAAAVEEKKAVESELLKEVKPAPATEARKAEAVASASAALDKATEKPSETTKAPALATAAPIVAPITAHQLEPAENGTAKGTDAIAVPKQAEPKPTETKVTVSKPVTLIPAPEAAEVKPTDAAVPKTADSKLADVPQLPADNKTADVSGPKVAEAPKPAETTPTVSKPTGTKPVGTAPAETKSAQNSATATEPGANGLGSKPTVAAAADKAQPTAGKAEATSDKKKGRLSTFISKLKGKLSDKH
ncbi:extensin-like protein [Cordyceps javanica]|nr:extensin-like protein [Cordyceps javanica]